MSAAGAMSHMSHICMSHLRIATDMAMVIILLAILCPIIFQRLPLIFLLRGSIVIQRIGRTVIANGYVAKEAI